MNTIYGFLLMVLLAGLAVLTDLVTYMTINGDFVIIALLLLAVLFVFTVFLYGTWVSKLFGLILFSMTLLSGVVLFPSLFPAEKLLVVLLLLVGSAGFVLILAGGRCKKKVRKKTPEFVEVPVPDGMVQPLPRSDAKDDDFVELDEIEKLMETPVKKVRRQATKRRKKRRKKK